MATFEPNIDWKTRTSGTLPIGEGQIAVMCPKCGSPYVATMGPDDPAPKWEESTVTIEDWRIHADRKTGKAIPFERTIFGAVPSLTCIAGDCGWIGNARIA